jgi:hypothetical protein
MFRAPIVNTDIPQDHAFVGVLLREAMRRNIKLVITGANWSSEFVLPRAWRGHAANDLDYLMSVHARFGTRPLKLYPRCSTPMYAYYRLVFGGEAFPILNYMDYDKTKAKEIIKERLGWHDYGGKHYESLFTKFHQGYYLPRKLGFDKRKAHLSNLIMSGSISREQAVEELSVPPLEDTEARLLLEHVANKLDLRPDDLDQWLSAPVRDDSEFKSASKSLLVKCARILGPKRYSRLADFTKS